MVVDRAVWGAAAQEHLSAVIKSNLYAEKVECSGAGEHGE